MLQQPLDYQASPQHQPTHPGRIVATGIATAANILLAGTAVWWHGSMWSMFRHNGGGWFGPEIFLIGTGVLLGAQFLLGVLPSSIIACQGTSLAPVNRRRLIASAWCGVLINILGFTFVLVY